MTYDEFAIINITAAGSRRYVNDDEIRLFCNDTGPGWASSSFGRATPDGLQLPSVPTNANVSAKTYVFSPEPTIALSAQKRGKSAR